MALHDPVVTLVSVDEITPDRYTITLRLVIPDNDAGATGIDQNFSLPFHTGTSPAIKVVEFRAMMQATINQYKRERVLEKAPLLATAITNIQSGLVI